MELWSEAQKLYYAGSRKITLAYNKINSLQKQYQPQLNAEILRMTFV
jgi:hypothetical protein